MDLTTEREMTRRELAEYMQEFATKLERGEKVTFMAGNESATVNSPETILLEIEISEGTSLLGTEPEQTVAFALHWQVSEQEDERWISSS